MKMLTFEEYKNASAFLKNKLLLLWEIENKFGIERDIAQTGFPISLSFKQQISNNDEIIVFENCSFRRHIDEYQKAFQEDKTLFQKGNAYVILKKMYEHSEMKDCNIPFERYEEIVCLESCSYILHKRNETFDPRVLRIDTFRKILENENKSDFIGGLFHALNHFTLDEKDKAQRNFIFDIYYLRYLSAYAFFLGNEPCSDMPKVASKSSDNTEIREIEDPKLNGFIRFVFFTELRTNISFIKTITPLKK